MKQKLFNAFNKEDLITFGVIFACLFLYSVFPVGNIFQQIISMITFLFVIPLLYVKIILKKSIKSLGIQKGNWQTGLFWSIIALVVSFLVEYIFFKYLGFISNYPLSPYLANNFFAFLGYEIFIVALFVALYEFFFRGFLMTLGLSERIGIWSVFLQSFVFLVLFFVVGGIQWSLLPFLIFIFWSGLIAYLSQSIVYSFATSIIFILIFDSFFIYLTR